MQVFCFHCSCAPRVRLVFLEVRRLIDVLALELWMVLKCHVPAGNQTWVISRMAAKPSLQGLRRVFSSMDIQMTAFKDYGGN